VNGLSGSRLLLLSPSLQVLELELSEHRKTDRSIQPSTPAPPTLPVAVSAETSTLCVTVSAETSTLRVAISAETSTLRVAVSAETSTLRVAVSAETSTFRVCALLSRAGPPVSHRTVAPAAAIPVHVHAPPAPLVVVVICGDLDSYPPVLDGLQSVSVSFLWTCAQRRHSQCRV
jgi:hypothetical protein